MALLVPAPGISSFGVVGRPRRIYLRSRRTNFSFTVYAGVKDVEKEVMKSRVDYGYEDTVRWLYERVKQTEADAAPFSAVSSKDDEEKKNDYYVNTGYAIRTLREEFPKLFYEELSFDIYREDIVFKDPLNTFSGIENYKSIFWALRFYGRIFFRALWVDIVSVWQPTENMIMVRWTVHGIPRIPWEVRSRFDGTSEYKLDREGKIYEHKVHNIALNGPHKFQVLSVDQLIQSVGCPSTPKPTYFELSTSSSTNRSPLVNLSAVKFVIVSCTVRYSLCSLLDLYSSMSNWPAGRPEIGTGPSGLLGPEVGFEPTPSIEDQNYPMINQTGMVPFNSAHTPWPAPPPPPPPPPPLPPVPPPTASFWTAGNVSSRLEELQDTLNLAKAMQKELEMFIQMKEMEVTTTGEAKRHGDMSMDRFLEFMKDNKLDLKFQESMSLNSANAIMSKLRFQLEPFRVVTDGNTPWEEKSAVKRLADKMEKYKRNKLWRKRKRRRVAENLAREREQFDKIDKEADEWRAREIAKDIAQKKVEKMKEIAKIKAKEEKKKLQSELELVLIVEKLQELRSIRIQKLKKQGHFFPEEDDKFLERVRAAVEEEERQSMVASVTDAAKDAIANAEESTKEIRNHSLNSEKLELNNDGGGERQDQKNEISNEGASEMFVQEAKRREMNGPSSGSLYDSVANLPMEFYHYYHGSNTDMGTLIEVRRTWDTYIRPGGSRIPGHWVQPPPPADDVNAIFLVKCTASFSGQAKLEANGPLHSQGPQLTKTHISRPTNKQTATWLHHHHQTNPRLFQEFSNRRFSGAWIGVQMWNSVANLKESLSKIALDVHDDDDEPSISTPQSRDRLENGISVSERRISRSFSRSNSPIVNGFDSPPTPEIQQYKTEIKRLQESEAEIKALSVNYAALLKEKEDLISKLTEENGSLKQNLLTTNAALSATTAVPKGSVNISPRSNKFATKVRTNGSPLSNGIISKRDELSNGTISNNGKELSDQMEDKNKSLAELQATHESQMKQMVVELDKERGRLATMRSRLEEEQKLNRSFQQELGSLKDENNKMLKEVQRTRDDLNQKISEIGRLQIELQRRDADETNGTIVELKTVIATLENETRNIKKEKDELEAALKAITSDPVPKGAPADVDPSNKRTSQMSEESPWKEEMQQSLRKLENDLKEASRERDKALYELNRLKQHLLEKESEESEKMDEDSKVIEELREINGHQRVQISRLEKALTQAIAGQEEIKVSSSNELMRAKDTIDELDRKLTSCLSTIDAKNMEILNLQTALGQYYAEIEAKERLIEELYFAKEESARLTNQLKEAHQQANVSKMEKEEILGRLSEAERTLADGKSRVKKLTEDNEKLRRALEQSMTRLNRMSVDSDFLVDRRIVIKLLVTYFQRNHSKEVLDLMVRMLGFLDEDKQRIGIAQQGAGKGVVRGVLGLPGRLVGGILGSGGGSAGSQAAMASDNQSFADLWVDFLLTETEKEKRGLAEGSNPAQDNTETSPSPSTDHKGSSSSSASSYLHSPFDSRSQMQSHSRPNFMQRENSDSEFSTVPLTSSESNSQGSRLLPRY
ncbi:Golgin candidate [Striga asiatica]|uniref:Golgin candidate n=1 Tax=Striga asiatica TaxID=4170 RepID=A0A5A7RJQ9_STRAF|nr:Golgin candidate [Striga asiatica]